ncbi:hypothetical protein MKD38_21615 [Cupriavidus sp. WGlv3]|uniref:hypothetical protein n=1 Tax=Cupriavidus sp. WGlv3 TaxID=2919924 RepID=UPI002091E513|nr:hypothetical protein [Cupriavidus sp. WGlv3]MCO4864285.1 hypothetical protein [Cupriavidus sp. WGlv3]
MQKALPWFILSWLLAVVTLGAVTLNAAPLVAGAFYIAAALAGVTAAEYLERERPTFVSDLVWTAVPLTLFLFPLALVLLSVRIYKVWRNPQARAKTTRIP